MQPQRCSSLTRSRVAEFGYAGGGYYPQPYNYYYTGPWWRDGCYSLPDGPPRWQCWQRQRLWGRRYFGARGYYYYPVHEP